MVSVEAGAVAANQSAGNKNVKNIRERPVCPPSVTCLLYLRNIEIIKVGD
jgi:hypothetical protein